MIQIQTTHHETTKTMKYVKKITAEGRHTILRSMINWVAIIIILKDLIIYDRKETRAGLPTFHQTKNVEKNISMRWNVVTMPRSGDHTKQCRDDIKEIAEIIW